MKIIFEVGDLVYPRGQYGLMPWRVIRVNKTSLTVENDFGERIAIGIKQAQPSPRTIHKAERIKLGEIANAKN